MRVIMYMISMNYGYFHLIAIENLISSICLLSEKYYSNIASELDKLKDERFHERQFHFVRVLLDEYVRCNKFSCLVAEFFEQHFVIFFFAGISRTILHCIMFLVVIKSDNPMDILKKVSVFTHALLILARLVSLSYRCQQVESKVRSN